ncbi:hypothetical protein MKW92_004850, partial [Papaver armeniacum]
VDPFSGYYLTEDMLDSDDDLKERVEEFISFPLWKSMQSNAKETIQKVAGLQL